MVLIFFFNMYMYRYMYFTKIYDKNCVPIFIADWELLQPWLLI